MPELYQPADKASVAKRRAAVIGVLFIGLFFVLGGVVGGVVVEGTHPNKADVLAAARSLVPPGYRVTSERLDTYEDSGVGFAAPTYAVGIDVEGGGAPESRLTDFQRQATGEGWPIAEDTGVATFLRFQRGGILASVNIGGEGGLSTIEAFRLSEPSQWPMVTYAGLGALLGLAISVGGFLALRRRW